ncbi:MAG TPA: CHAT domain-containing protein, partial [Acidimicrobiales bacterium]|nr:CHAT domain-containing protein [Acidimicrobiales bacterium]
RTFVGRVALALGRGPLAERELSRAAEARGRGPVGQRATAWHATALARLAGGDRAGAKAALRKGLAVVDAYRAGLGATELRVGAAAHGEDLARLGLRLALADRRAWEVLRWAERWRAGSLRLPPVAPPADSALAGALSELRAAEADLREATLAGAAGPGPRGRLARAERAVRDRARRGPSAAGTPPVRAFDGAALPGALGDRALVELVNVEGHLHAVTVAGGRASLHAVAPVARVEDEVQFLLFALRRVLAPAVGGGRRRAPVAVAATGRPRSAPPVAALMADVDEAARRVDDLLLGPLGLAPGQPVVVVPTHPLHQLPWGALPSLAARTVTVTPSAALWLRRAGARATAAPGRTVIVAGPDLPGAEDEVAALARLHPGGVVLRGPDATVERVLAALSGAAVAHVAAHGRFRSDSPLLSSLGLADGAFTIYDLERLARPPVTFVLPACNAAVARVARGDEVVGTAAALVGLGVRSVLAPVLPVPDEAAAPFSVAIHTALRAGRPAAGALSAARAAVAADPWLRALGAAFVCIGVDDSI